MIRHIFSAITILSLAIPLSARVSADTVRLKEHVFYLASEALLGRGFGTAQGREAAMYIACLLYTSDAADE